MRRILNLLFVLLLTTLPVSEGLARPDITELDHIVAVVNKDIITLGELDTRVRLIKQQLQKSNTHLPEDDILRKQVLERMVIDQIQLQIADTTGIRVDDETINRVIGNIAHENKLSLDQFRQVLSKDGVDFAGFRRNIRNEIVLSQLQKREVESRVQVTEQEVDNYLATVAKRSGYEDEYHVLHILIPVPESATPDRIEEARKKGDDVMKRLQQGADFAETAIAVSAGQQALQGGDLGWLKGGQLPTVLADQVTRMKPGELEGPVRSASGFHIIKLLDKRSPQPKHLIVQTLARHILLKPDAILSSDAAEKRLQEIRKRIVAGEDFGKLAQAYSEDKASASEGGSLGWTTPGSLVPQFQTAMDELKPGEISPPFQSQFGWHIVQVMARRNHDDTTTYLRAQARQQIQQRKMSEEMDNWLRRIRDEAYVDYRLDN